MILTAEHVDFAYPGQAAPAVSGIELRIAAGEIVALIGPNGAGKSTLLALLAGWLKPDAGRVTLDGEPLGRLGLRRRARRLAYLPQRVTPLYDPTVEDVVTAGRFPYRSPWAGPSETDRRTIAAALEATATLHVRGRRFTALSGGEQQRVLVASILAQEPEFLLLDEPTASLDMHHQVEIFRLLRSIASGGRAVVVATHDLNLASLYADRLLLLIGGRLVHHGTPADVLTPETLNEAYGAELTVIEHPLAGRPAVLPDGSRTP
ncbi:MAG: ABC transporter ATP-binding protein [Acidobacteria bacterium]|nr:ABC transporter ATP-binding protein [Acidobacteriota bacterium]